jgi:hypothetical protein
MSQDPRAENDKKTGSGITFHASRFTVESSAGNTEDKKKGPEVWNP